MNNQELFSLIRDSRLAQVAKPLSKRLRGDQKGPTHQIIYAPKSSAIRSNYGIKSALPKQIGFGHIVYNDIDNKKNMPDVEKYSGPYYNRLKFQESGIPVKTYYNENNPLFPNKTTKSQKDFTGSQGDNLLAGLNLGSNSSAKKVSQALESNPQLYEKFQQFLVKHYPETILSNIPMNVNKLLKEFFSNANDVKKQPISLVKQDNEPSSYINEKLHGTGGFSYLQKGRLQNSPNGLKYGSIVPGRIVGDKEAAIGGFVAGVNDRSIVLQRNYVKNYPGKHPRQFVMPFKLNEAEITENGRIKLYADGVRAGSWMKGSDNDFSNNSNYEASNPGIKGASERNAKKNIPLENLLNLIGNSSN